MAKGVVLDDQQLRLIAVGEVVSEQFGGVDPSYMTQDSLSLRYDAADKAILSVTLIKAITHEQAQRIADVWRGVSNV